MAKIQCDFKSKVLSKSMSMTVILPEESISSEYSSKKTYPVLYLLHGYSDDHTTWVRNTSIERYAHDLGLAVVMPGMDNSYYTDMKYGGAYWTFLTEELPLLTQSFFPVTNDPMQTFAAGHSMGGFGVLKWGLSKPERFRAIASLSGVTDMAAHLENTRMQSDDKSDQLSLIFGKEDIRKSQNDILWLLENASTNKRLPMLYQTCGTEDFLYPLNVRFQKKCEALHLSAVHHFEKGDHTWDFWDQAIQRVLAWLPIHSGEEPEHHENKE